MGYNRYGELGDGTTNNVNIPELIVPSGVTNIAAGSLLSLFLKADGSLWGSGYNYEGQLGDGFTNSILTVPELILPSPQPVLTNTISAATNLQFTANCPFGGTFYLLTGTNLAQPLSQWTVVSTTTINNRTNNLFTATLTNAANPTSGPKFFRLLSK